MRFNPETGRSSRTTGKLLSATGGLVFQTEEGVEVFQCSGLPEDVKVNGVPEGLVTSPELSLQVTTDEAGPRELTVSYISSGFSWEADYVVTLDQSREKAHMLGWLTIDNLTSGALNDAPAVVIAGSVQTFGETSSDEPTIRPFNTYCWPQGTTKGPFPMRNVSGYAGRERDKVFADSPVMSMAPMAMESSADQERIVVTGARVAQEEAFGDYKLFRTPEAISLLAYQTKQIAFLDTHGVELKRRYAFEIEAPTYRIDDRSATVRFDIDNSREGTLARSLPEGTMRFMTHTPDGMPLFLGEGRVRNLAVDLPVEVDTRLTSLVRLSTEIGTVSEAETKEGNLLGVYVMTAAVTNDTGETVSADIELADWLGEVQDYTIVAESAPRFREIPYPTWRIDIPAYETKTLKWTIRMRSY